MSCPDADTLATFPSLPDDQRAVIVDHAAECSACRAIISSMLGMAETAAEVGAPPKSDVPEKIDRYVIERRIGAGAMGVVFAGHDPELARPVAVKVLLAGGSAERMKREAQALAKLTHPNVVAVYDVGEHEGSTFVTMALVDGENLRSWLQREHTTDEIVEAIRQAARGVDAAHRVGIVHRDLKPDNIFVARTGEVLVGDFGLARSAGPEAREDIRMLDSNDLTRTGTVVGTPAYMAPEQVDGDASAASDQFALCVTAYEALYGFRPFRGKTIGELERNIRQGLGKEPRTQRTIPWHVRAAIRRGLEADPAKRHPSVGKFLEALSPPRQRWPYAVVAALGAAGVGAYVLRGGGGENREAHCADIKGPTTTGPGLAKLVIPQLKGTTSRLVDRYAADWTKLARESCVANARRELSDPFFAATTRCLDRRAATLTWALAWPEPTTMLNVVEALEPIETCRGVQDAVPAPKLAELQGELDQVAVLVDASPKNTTEETAVFIQTATALGDPGALAEATYLHGLARLAAGFDPEAELRSAISHADRARDDRLRARASALLGVTLARDGRTTEAALQRDAAASAAERVGDPATSIAVERANISIALARQDLPAQLGALKRIEALQLARYGESSLSLMNTRFEIAGVLHRMNDPKAAAALDLATSMFKSFSQETPLIALQAASVATHSPLSRIVLSEQIVALTRREDPSKVPEELSNLSLDYELAGDFEHELATAKQGLAVVEPGSSLQGDLLEAAANGAYEIADRTDDPPTRTRHLDEATQLIEKMPPAIRDSARIQSLHGRVLFLQARYAEARDLLAPSLASAEKEDPPNPYRIAMRSFVLAQVLWEIGTGPERQRALALAEQAAKRFPEAREIYASDEQYGAAAERVDRMIEKVAAWRTTHH